MKLKKRLGVGVVMVTALWFLCVLLGFPPLHSSKSVVVQRTEPTTPSPPPPTSTQPAYNDSKWEACFIPNDVDNLCKPNTNSTPKPSSCPLGELVKDCDALKRVHGYEKPVEQEELEFPLAFGIKVHTAPEQAEQLLRAIYRPHNLYCIHVDKKANESVFRVISSIAACFPNIILTDRVSFVYASYDSIRSELRTMACAIQSTVNWKYYLNLAGQEFPLRSNLEIVRILNLLNGTNDIESFPMPKTYQIRYKRKFKVIKGKLMKLDDVKEGPPFEFEIRKGTQYSAFSRAFIAALYYDEAARSILSYFSDSLIPEESIWGTINQLPWIPGSYTGEVRHSPNNEHISRAVAWWKVDSYKCKGKYVREVCIFTQDDLPWILKQPNLFANKFRADMDYRPEACLEAVLDRRVRSGLMNINLTYYESLPHVKHRK